jgi:hypothetical protein
MKLIHLLFPAGHFVIGLLFLASAFALIGVAAVQLWSGVQLFDEVALPDRLNTVLESIAVLTVAVAALPFAFHGGAGGSPVDRDGGARLPPR